MPEIRNTELVGITIDRFKEISVDGEKTIRSVIEVKISPIIADFFKGKGTKKTINLLDKYYRMLENGVEKDKAEFWLVPNDLRTGDLSAQSLFINESLNEGILRFVDADKGITFVIKEGITKEVMEDSARKFTENIRKFYRDYISPVRVKISINIDEM